MDLRMFENATMGELVEISGADRFLGRWDHHAFVPCPLGDQEPALSGATYRAIAAAGRALAALDASARQLPSPSLLRIPALRREAQSTSALEGAYAPLDEVLTADEDSPATVEMTEILNYVSMAEAGFTWVQEGRPLTIGLIENLQGLLMRGTALEGESGRLRTTQVVIGRRDGAAPGAAPIHASRFVPVPPGDRLRAGVTALVDWFRQDHSGAIDPVVVAGMAHYQFETLHPFRDGNGRLGRYLIVLTLLGSGMLSEPTLTVSPWFEARRTEYYDALLGVSTRGDWDAFLTFFAQGLEAAAVNTREQMLVLAGVQDELRGMIRSSPLRSAQAPALVDFAVAHPSFTVRRVQEALGLSYGRANSLVGQLVDLGVLQPIDPDAHPRRFTAPRVLRALLSGGLG
ncbi:Fic family protein [Actinomyces bowdenii]|uniref:Fic family protein n=2 Tax=Actinomyces bowdenii TaxID=131109 RepID=A0A853EKZ1_9ACTO|nr:Fic family protein [Actinomyces bowdenii]NYS68516.1 Fic family protein [Actinomyces bowdenii]